MDPLLTADDLLRLYSQGVRGELVRGVLHETMASGHRHGKIAVNIVTGTGQPLRKAPEDSAQLVASDSGVWLERDPDTVREPDVAFTSAEKIPLGAEIDGYAEVVPDLVVEIVSPRDTRPWARDRAQMWLDYGAPLVWIIHPKTRTVDVYRPNTRHLNPPRAGLPRRPRSPPRLHLPRQHHLRLKPGGTFSSWWPSSRAGEDKLSQPSVDWWHGFRWFHQGKQPRRWPRADKSWERLCGCRVG